MALELQQDVIRPRKTPEKAIEPAASAPSRDGLVQVRVRGPRGKSEGGEGKIFTGVTRSPTDPLSKTDPFPTHKIGDIVWVNPEAAEIYDARRWVDIVEDV